MVASGPHIANDSGDADSKPVRLAVYDFDGTLLAGKSPVILLFKLFRERSISFPNLFAIGLWGLAYKMHVPPNEAWVRNRVFRAFQGKKQEQVDAYLGDFYETSIAHRLRPVLLEQIEKDRADGCVIVTVSATFAPIVERMAQLGVVDYQVATSMVVDENGCYVARVDGLPVEGDEKLARLQRFADEKFGAGNWRIARAYSDHYSDRPLLYAADEPTAVHPDHSLHKTAEQEGWPIIED
ncbi:MAG: HAD-IB family hydrolase [Coriobacteriaceae bacterium]|nr:HAD-IB family hydrolase [Coriobacteriaceae bacterium]